MSASNDFSRLQPFANWRNVCVVLAGLLCAVQVNAQVTAPDSAFERFMANTTGQGKQTVAFSSNGTPVLSPGVPQLSTDGGAKINVSRAGSILNPSGNPVAINASAKVAGSVVGAMIKKALPLLPYIGTAVSIYQAAQEAGFTLSKDSSGSVVVEKNDPAVCSVAPCYKYHAASFAGEAVVGYFSTPSVACATQAAQYSNGSYTLTVTGFTMISATAGYCTGVVKNGSGAVTGTYTPAINTVTVAPSPVVLLPSTDQELADAIAAKSGWPSTSAIAQALADAQKATGDKIATETPTVTGPATSTGSSKTVNNPDGTKSVTTTTHNHTYNGNNVTTSTTNVTNNYNSSNQIISTTTETKTPEPDAKTDCDKYPDSNGCRTDEYDTPSLEIPKTTKTVSYTPETWFGGGSCPADKAMTTHGGQVLKVWDYQQTCSYLISYVRPVLLILASMGAMVLLIPKGST